MLEEVSSPLEGMQSCSMLFSDPLSRTLTSSSQFLLLFHCPSSPVPGSCLFFFWRGWGGGRELRAESLGSLSPGPFPWPVVSKLLKK